MREYLKVLREEHGFTMQEMANRIGITKQYYQLIENGSRQKKMDITLVQQLSSIFGISIECIINEENKLTETA